MTARLAGRAPLAALTLLAILACGGEPPARILVLGFDGMDPEAVQQMVAAGELPHFARLGREGASGTLRVPEPLLSPIVWTSIATGKDPIHHGIRGFTTVDPVSGEEVPVTSRMRRTKALWNLFSDAGREVAVVGWWATWPPEPVLGSIVSDRTAYHFLFAQGFAGGADADALAGRVHPPELAAEISPLLRRPDQIGVAEIAPFAHVPAAELAAPIELSDDLGHLRWALATATSYADVGLHLWRHRRPRLELVYFEATDSVAHLFGHLWGEEELAGDLAEQQRRYGETVRATYRLADEILGEYLAERDENTTLVVLSDHGFELGALHADPRRSRDLRRVSERFHRPEGILYLYGRGIRPGAKIEGAGVLDVTPTVLALAGLPAADDMPGRVLTEVIAEPSRLPVERVASYEGDGQPADAGGDDVRRPAEERAQLERLRSLGYLGGSSPGETGPESRASGHSDRVLAALLFEQGRLGEAERLYRRLLEAAPDDSALLASLAATLGRQDRFAEAEELLDRAVAANPLQPQAHHNRAVLLERRGATEEAIAAYRRALLVDPGFAPARRALVQLTGDDRLRPPPENARQRQALESSTQAAQAAQRGDYARALELLDEAEALAPERPEIFQHRSNVAYLMGDRDAAVRALERGLELEPDNPLMAENLRRLQRSENEDGS